MRTVFKFELPILTDVDDNDQVHVKMPRGANVLHVGVQEGGVFVWAIVDRDEEFTERHFGIIGTGNRIDHVEKPGNIYVGTVHHGPFVWHVFEVFRDDEADRA